MSRRTGVPDGAIKNLTAPSSSSAGPDHDNGLEQQKKLLVFSDGHFSMIRALHLADLITEMNGLCGILSIFSSMRYCLEAGAEALAGGGVSGTAHTNPTRYLWYSLVLMPLGLFFDFMDGKVARWRRKSSMMGQELDSLADLISFGMAPAAFAYAIGLRTTVDSLLLCFFVLSGLSRLARFNVTAASLPKDATGKAKYFEGTPIPTTLTIAGLMAYWTAQGWFEPVAVPGSASSATIAGKLADKVGVAGAADTAARLFPFWASPSAVPPSGLPGGVLGRGTAWEMHPVVLIFVLSGCLMVSRTLHIPKP